MADPVAEYLKSQAKPVFVEFVVEAIKLEHASQQAGRPIFEDREFVNIMVIGARGATAHEPVNDEHKARWPKEYAAFKAGITLPPEGTPLGEWADSQMTKSRVMELAYFNIRTVEELAAVTDGNLPNLGMGAHALRERAKTYLEIAAKGTGPIERLVTAKLAAESEVIRLTAELREANGQILALKAQLKGLEHAA